MGRPFRITGTFDCETHSWDQFVVGATFDGHRARVWYSLDEMIDEMRKIGGTWFGHASGVFDSLAILDRALKRGIACQIDRSQHRVTRVVMGRLTLRDSYALWPAPLDELCGALGMPVPSLPWGCICGKKCGGYCLIGPKAKEGEPELEEYVIADVRRLYEALHLLNEFTGSHKIALKGTLGQTAWKAAQDELGIPDSTIDFALWRHIRAADRGGRTAVIRPKAAGPGTHHDICQAYPAQLAKTALPMGAYREVGSRIATTCLANARPGVYSCSVRVPDNIFLPPLPWLHGGSMNFPTGRFHGTWTLPELGCAIDRGVEIEKVHSAVVWADEVPLFADLVQRWYDIRKSVGRKTPLGSWVGKLSKALAGKFAERPERSRVTMHPEEIKICNREGACEEGCSGRCGAYEQLDLFGHIWSIPYSRMAPSAYPQWSAYLRAGTRIQWLEQAERFGTDLAMGNTDSLWSVGRIKPEPLGDGLGEWEYQNDFYDLEVRSPAVYAYRTEAPTSKLETKYVNGRRVTERVSVPGPLVIRGVPGLTAADWARGTGVIDRGVVTFGAAVKGTGSLFKARSRRWSLPKGEREIYGDRRLGSSGVTYPMDAQQIREMVAAKKRLRVGSAGRAA